MPTTTTTILISTLLLLCHTTISEREIIDVDGGPDDVVWVVQLSDLHFSVHHPDRAADFRNLVGPALSIIKPSLVLITGDLTDGKSKDLLTMKQDKEEWVEYDKVMDDVIRRSGLEKSVFYDLRGNHDIFGVPSMGGSFDFFSTHSLNGQLGRGLVNSITVQNGKRKVLFVGLDSAMSAGLRGPTNLFGHPTEEMLNEIDSELSKWESENEKTVTRIAFGHFPVSFTAPSNSGKTLKDVLLQHCVSTYLCGHLHTRFGKNLKRHHVLGHHLKYTQNFFQLNPHQTPPESSRNCSNRGCSVQQFWEWEMGDWRRSRAMRILAIDRSFVSFLDTDFKMGVKNTFVLPTFPLDSRYISTSMHNYKCQANADLSFGSIRALVFSDWTVVSVTARIYDSNPGNLYTVMETSMRKHENTLSRGDLYTTPWNFRAFEDPSPNRFWLEIEAIDIKGRSTLSELRPFSVNGIRASFSWTWKEFYVMGCQWANLYYPIFWLFYLLMFTLLIIPKVFLFLSRKQYTYKDFTVNKSFINGVAWVSAELYKIPFVWQFMTGYLFYLLLCPWLLGQVFTEGGERGYMTYRGWVLKFNKAGKLDFVGFPDVMVIVLPHLYFVVLPSILLVAAVAADREIHRDCLLSLSGKKKDDLIFENKESIMGHRRGNGKSKFFMDWSRCILAMVALAICWKHLKSCRALVNAYEMNPFVHFPFYCFSIPLLLAYVFYKTRRV